MQIFMVILGILMFLALIAVHEFGHFSMAKFLNINVYEFAVGVGPVIWRKERGRTRYSLRAVPLGGFCSFEDSEQIKDDDDIEDIIKKQHEDPQDFVNQPAWAKILVLLAGALFNFLFAILLIGFVFFFYNGMKVSLFICFKQAMLLIGIYVVTIFQWITGLFRGVSDTGEVSGIVGIVSTISEQASYGAANLLYFIGVLSINLGIMNLLPIPALDGGRIVFTVIRKLSGGRFTEEAEMLVNGIGMMLLLGLMVFLIIRDTFGLFG